MVRKIKDETLRALSGWNPLELQQITKGLKKKADQQMSLPLGEHKKIQRASLIERSSATGNEAVQYWLEVGEQLKSLSDGSLDFKGGVV